MRARVNPAAGLAIAGLAILVVVLVVAQERHEPRSPAGAPTAPSDGKPHPDLHLTPTGKTASHNFELAGTPYAMVGFRSEGSVCASLIDLSMVAGSTGAGRNCLAEPLLREAIAERPVHIFGGGGGKHTFIVGFARADVVDISLLGSYGDSRSVLSDPWRPEPWQGKPIRFFYIVSDKPPHSVDGESPILGGVRGEARLSGGERVRFSS
jgi:hypothetical protein